MQNVCKYLFSGVLNFYEKIKYGLNLEHKLKLKLEQVSNEAVNRLPFH